MASLSSRCLAEGVGTLLLVYFGTGAAVITLLLAAGNKPATAFNVGIGQLGGLGDWLAIGLVFGIVVAAVIYALGRVSGAHINPSVTIALWATKRFPSVDTAAYVVSQCIGAAAGSLLLFLTLGAEAVTVGGLGATAPFPGIGYGQAVLVEAIATFVLMLVIMGVAVDPRATLYLPYDRAYRGRDDHDGREYHRSSINPARTFGPYLMDGLLAVQISGLLPDLCHRPHMRGSGRSVLLRQDCGSVIC